MCTTSSQMDFGGNFENVFDSHHRPSPTNSNPASNNNSTGLGNVDLGIAFLTQQNPSSLIGVDQTFLDCDPLNLFQHTNTNNEETGVFPKPQNIDCNLIKSSTKPDQTFENDCLKQNKGSNKKSEDQKNKTDGEKPANPTSYKYLSWREKDRRRRFREEWKNLWLVIPHGKYEVMCLVCHKVMTQRKLDTIKRHTIRRHVELLSMTDADRQVLFNLLLSVHNQQQIENGINPETGVDTNGNKIENGLFPTPTSAGMIPSNSVTGASSLSPNEHATPTAKGRGRGVNSTSKNLSPIASVQLKRMYNQQFSNTKNNSLMKKLRTDNPEKRGFIQQSPIMKENEPQLDQNLLMNFQDIFDQLKANLPMGQLTKQGDLKTFSPHDNIFDKLKQNIFNNSLLKTDPSCISMSQPTTPLIPNSIPKIPFPSCDQNFNASSNSMSAQIINNHFQDNRNNVSFINRQVSPNIMSLLKNNNTLDISNGFMDSNSQMNLSNLFAALTKVQPMNPLSVFQDQEKKASKILPMDSLSAIKAEGKDFKASHPFSVLSLAMNDGKEKNESQFKNKQSGVNPPGSVMVSLTSNNSNLQVHILNFPNGTDLIPSIELYLKSNNFLKAVILNCQGFVSTVSLKQIEDNLDQKNDVELNSEHRVISLSGMIRSDKVRDENLFLVLCNEKGELEGGRLSGEMIIKEEFKIVLLVMGQTSNMNGNKTGTDAENQNSGSKEKTLSDDSSSCYSAKTPDSSESPINSNRMKNLFLNSSQIQERATP